MFFLLVSSCFFFCLERPLEDHPNPSRSQLLPIDPQQDLHHTWDGRETKEVLSSQPTLGSFETRPLKMGNLLIPVVSSHFCSFPTFFDEKPSTCHTGMDKLGVSLSASVKASRSSASSKVSLKFARYLTWMSKEVSKR